MAVPTRRELHKARKRRRRPAERVLRIGIVVVVVLLVVAGFGYGYFRYEWSKVSSSPCSVCVAAANGAPYNVLVIGSDSRAGETAAEAQQFGTASEAAGQRSDTIKIVRVNPAAGTASSISIPRDTYVTLSGVPASTGLSTQNKINSAFAGGPDALIKTIQNTFGIPINHYIVLSFFGVQDAVNALGGISMDFPYPVRDQDCSTGVCYNNSGLAIPTTGCQVLDGAQALSLSRSRYFQYYADGQWNSDPTSDIGRIERQNLIIEAALDKAKSTYNPLRLNALLTSVVHDFSKDNGLTPRRPVLPGRALPRLLRIGPAVVHPAHGGGDLGAGRRRGSGPAPASRPDDRPVPRGCGRPHHHPSPRRLRQSPAAPRHHHHDGSPGDRIDRSTHHGSQHPDHHGGPEPHPVVRPPSLLTLASRPTSRQSPPPPRPRQWRR